MTQTAAVEALQHLRLLVIIVIAEASSHWVVRLDAPGRLVHGGNLRRIKVGMRVAADAIQGLTELVLTLLELVRLVIRRHVLDAIISLNVDLADSYSVR